MTFRHSTPPKPALWTLVPAAGIGSRMGADRPKSYLHLGDQYLIDVTLQRLLGVDSVSLIHLALHPQDRWWPQTQSAQRADIVPYVGGVERHDSVRAGLELIRPEAHPEDWVMVHDVARPCVSGEDIQALLEGLSSNPVGGLLAAPVVDTIKQVSESGAVERTLDRSRIWRALTPQLFRYGVLDRALRHACKHDLAVTDEASAVEALGLQPQIIRGRADNIKVTVPEDLELAAWLLGTGH